MYKISNKFKNKKRFIFCSCRSIHYDYSYCKSLDDAIKAIKNDFDDKFFHENIFFRENTFSINMRSHREVISDAENCCDYAFALGYVVEIKEV